MATGGEPSPSPPSPPKHSRSPDDPQPDASPKRRKRHHHRRHHRRHRDADSPVAVATQDEVEEGEILDDAAATDVDADLAAHAQVHLYLSVSAFPLFGLTCTNPSSALRYIQASIVYSTLLSCLHVMNF